MRRSIELASGQVCWRTTQGRDAARPQDDRLLFHGPYSLALFSPDGKQVGVNASDSPTTLRLLAAACCRRVWHLMTDERSRRMVEVFERHNEGQATDAEWAEAGAAAHAAWGDTSRRPWPAALTTGAAKPPLPLPG